MEKTIQKEKGITLIALIITVIVMLILVGVTINVALNGGLFDSTTQAATETKKEAEKEQLLSAVVGAIGTDGKVDSTKISLPEGFTKDESKSTSSKLVVKGKEVVWQVNLNSGEIEPYSESSTGATTYTFTIGELGDKGLLGEDESEGNIISEADFWGANVSETLKNSTKIINIDGTDYEIYNITCSDSNLVNFFDSEDPSTTNAPGFTFAAIDGNIWLMVKMGESDDTFITKFNYTNYRNISFTISMW